MEENYGHKPVLLHECLGALAIKPDGIYVDGTLGRAGHSLEIVRRLTTGRLIALDRDETAIEAANRRLGDYLDKVTLVHSNFSALDAVLHELGVRGVDGMLFDLGVSSPQLDEAQRGFSYKQDAPLDMRMDESAALTAREVVNTYSYEELRRILFEYGEERYAPAIAKRICQHREQKPIETTLELADIIRSAMPASALREKQHPAKRSFQAIRIAVNDELGELLPMLDAVEKNLKPGGRLAVITFHSLEDRIVKKKLQELAQGCICPPEQQIIVCHCSIRNRSSQTAGDMQSCFIIIIAVRHTAIQLSKLLFQFLSWHILYIAYELVSTDPAFQRLGKQFIHFIRKRAQYRISKQMSVCIVDLFKTIHIQNNKVSHLSPFHFLQSVCDLLLDGGMIQKSSQGIPL